MRRISQAADNCLQASVASILEISIDVVPHFLLAKDWREALDDFLAKYDLKLALVKNTATSFLKKLLANSYYLMLGYSDITVKTVRHACVGFNGKIVHDPHPDKIGLECVNEIGLFLVKDPSIIKIITNNAKGEENKSCSSSDGGTRYQPCVLSSEPRFSSGRTTVLQG